jgi:putative acetyltransferase
MNRAVAPPVTTGRTRHGRRYRLRAAREGDTVALLRLHDAVAAEARWMTGVPGSRSALEQTLTVASAMARGDLMLVAEVGGDVVGEVTVSRRWGPASPAIADLAIAIGDGYRDEGLGRALIEAAIAWSRASGLVRLALRVLPDNRRAIALYRKLGFEEEGRSRGDGERELLLMALALD